MVDAPRPEHSWTPTPRDPAYERLVALLEQASEGAAWLDQMIWRWDCDDFRRRGGTDAQWLDLCAARANKIPKFTRSLDAAVTLVPEGFAWSAQSSQQFPGQAWLYPPNNIADIEFQADAASAPLALCIASLRARAGGL